MAPAEPIRVMPRCNVPGTVEDRRGKGVHARRRVADRPRDGVLADLDKALEVADRACVLKTGRITANTANTAQGSGRELRHDPTVRAAYLGRQ